MRGEPSDVLFCSDRFRMALAAPALAGSCIGVVAKKMTPSTPAASIGTGHSPGDTAMAVALQIWSATAMSGTLPLQVQQRLAKESIDASRRQTLNAASTRVALMRAIEGRWHRGRLNVGSDILEWDQRNQSKWGSHLGVEGENIRSPFMFLYRR